MDILNLIDRLEELFNSSRAVPFSKNILVDEDKFLDLIDQMRVTIPEEIKNAQKMFSDRDRTLAQAQEQAQRTIRMAREQSADILERDSMVEEAKARGERVLEQARLDAEATRLEADEYVLESLTNLEREMERVLSQIRNGMRELQHQATHYIKPQDEPAE